MKSVDLPCMRADRRRVWDWSTACNVVGEIGLHVEPRPIRICFDEPETDPYFSIGAHKNRRTGSLFGSARGRVEACGRTVFG
jgi:hypothetical protein